MAAVPTHPKLFQLPAELLHMIFQHLDSSDFRRQPTLLRLSKEWYSLVQPVLYRDVSVNLSTILRIGRGRARFLKTLPELMQQYTVNLSLIIYVPDFRYDFGRLASLSWISPDVNPFKQYEDMISKGMSRLVRMLKTSLKLRQVTFEMQPEYSVGPFPEEEFSIVTVWPFLHLPLFLNLSTLYIDTVASTFHNFHGPDGLPEGCHPCSVIGQILPRLKSLRCRFREICPDVLKPPLDAGNLDLEEVIINLSIVPDVELGDGEESSLCKPFRDANPGAHLHVGLYDAASRLARRMKQPSMLRIVESSFTGYDILFRKPIYFGGHSNIGIQDWDRMLVEVSESDEDTDRGGLMTEEEEAFGTELWEDEESLEDGDEIDTSVPGGAAGGHGKD
ncbi:uncharacterized protein E0L32_002577 [Thyridium curvatum]|uniref:F-box domain-containing protein n=1 Tax=Thyridium curvatum TaxID=1093900 RepID=A0A507BPN4_9PEZI|nr:uncharacterized protein E0L32_002577 [Thyridium curvatum]TPX18720.1 hypothetical protein E0L32_002577 [Thyridium curvatum]